MGPAQSMLLRFTMSPPSWIGLEVLLELVDAAGSGTLSRLPVAPAAKKCAISGSMPH